MGCRRESVYCTLYLSTLGPERTALVVLSRWPRCKIWPLVAGLPSSLGAFSMCIGWLVLWENLAKTKHSDIGFSLAPHAYDLYFLLFVCKICHVERTFLSWKVDLIFSYIEHYGNVSASTNPFERLGGIFLLDPCLSCDSRRGCKQGIRQRGY